MRTMSHYLIIMLAVMLFIFRIIVLITTIVDVDFIVKSSNVQYEMILLVVTLICIILMSKSKLTGAIIYVITSMLYYGPGLLNYFQHINAISAEEFLAMAISLIYVLIPLFSFFIILAAKKQEKKPVDKKTDFFYKNEAYDRKYDERADRNNYRTM